MYGVYSDYDAQRVLVHFPPLRFETLLLLAAQIGVLLLVFAFGVVVVAFAIVAVLAVALVRWRFENGRAAHVKLFGVVVLLGVAAVVGHVYFRGEKLRVEMGVD